MPQTWDPQTYQQDGNFVAVLGEPLIDLLSPQVGERILDLGCGNGELTEKIARSGAHVLGVDSSEGFVDATAARGLDARVMDGQTLRFDHEFDAVFSNAAMHWMKDADAVLSGVNRALKTGGRFISEMGGQGNVRSVCDALAQSLAKRDIDPDIFNPWYFPGEEYREKLEAHGFKINELMLFERPTEIATDIRNWLALFAGSFLDAAPANERAVIVDEVRDAVKDQLLGEDGVWRVDYVRLRFSALKVRDG